MDVTAILVYGVPAVAIVVGLVQVAKAIGFPSKYGGVLAIGLGVGLMLLYTYYADAPWAQAVVFGIVIGLAAAGVYSTTKNAAGH